MNSKEKNTISCKMIYIYGSGGRGKLIREILLRSKQKAHNIMFIDDIKKSFNNSNFLFKEYDHKTDQIFIGISDPIIHKKKYQELKKKLKKIDNQPLIDPTAIIKSNVKLNKNIIICENANIGPNSKIENNVFIGINALINHDCKIGKFSTIGHGANLAGNVKIKDDCVIGISSTFKQNVVIEKNVTIGSGANVINKCLKNSIYVGNPAKKLSKI